MSDLIFCEKKLCNHYHLQTHLLHLLNENFHFGYSNNSKSNIYKPNNYKDSQNEKIHLKDAEDGFVDDSGYTVSSNKKLDRSISTADIELANKINILKESGLI